MKVGYTRVSTGEQNLEMQQDALKNAGVSKVFSDIASGGQKDRPGLTQCLEYLRNEQDTLVVWRLDRIGRSVSNLIEIVASLKERGICFFSLHENLETETPSGRLTFHVFAALAEFEKDLLRQRTVAGLAAARARGRVGGRPQALTEKQKKVAQSLYRARDLTVNQISEQLGVSRSTLYRFYRNPRKC